jgi:hypothetical protein
MVGAVAAREVVCASMNGAAPRVIPSNINEEQVGIGKYYMIAPAESSSGS